MSKFKDKILQVVKTVPRGSVVSYGQVALMAGVPRAARQVGWVLHFNEDPSVPWWRVINNAGRISTNCVEHAAQMQKELLEEEGVKVGKYFSIDIERYRFRPPESLLEKLELGDEYRVLLAEKFGL